MQEKSAFFERKKQKNVKREHKTPDIGYTRIERVTGRAVAFLSAKLERMQEKSTGRNV